MNEFAPRVPQQVLESVLPQALGHMANLATTCGGLGLVLVLSTMGRCLKVPDLRALPHSLLLSTTHTLSHIGMLVASQAGPTVAAAAEPGLTPPLVQLWQKYATNYQVAPTVHCPRGAAERGDHSRCLPFSARGQITEIFNVLVNLPACNEGLLSRLWPTVSAVIGSPPNKFEPGTIEVRVTSLLHGEGKRLVVQ